MVVVRGHGQRHVDRRQEREHVGLDERHEDSKGQKDYGYDHGNESREDFKHEVIAVDVAEKTQRQRQRTDRVRNEFDHEEHRRHPPHRPQEVSNVGFKPGAFDAHNVVIDEHAQADGEIRAQIFGRRPKTGEEAEHVADEDVDENRADEREVILAMMRNDALNKVQKAFNGDLKDVFHADPTVRNDVIGHGLEREPVQKRKSEDHQEHHDAVENIDVLVGDFVGKQSAPSQALRRDDRHHK